MKTDLKTYLKSHNKDVVGYKVKYSFYIIGPSNYLNSWFSTIISLDNSGVFSNGLSLINRELYYGKLRLIDIPNAIAELELIKDKFKDIPSFRAVWDIDDINNKPDWPDFIDINKDCSLYDFYTNIDGNNLIDITAKAMKEAQRLQWDLLINQMFGNPNTEIKADQESN